MCCRFLKKSEDKTRGQLDAEYFLQLSKTNSALLYQCCLLQTKLRSRAGGEQFWKRLENLRVDHFGRDFMSVDVILRFKADVPEIKRYYEKRDKKRAA